MPSVSTKSLGDLGMTFQTRSAMTQTAILFNGFNTLK